MSPSHDPSPTPARAAARAGSTSWLSPHSLAGLVSLLASVLAATIYAFDGFDHGIWLVAYLFLVGFAAQLLLGRGQAALLAAVPAASPRTDFQVALWNAGVILVPAGVLAGVRLPVVTGGIALLAALSSFARVTAETRPGQTRPAKAPRAGPWLAQIALIAFMAASVFVGTALAWDTPWL